MQGHGRLRFPGGATQALRREVDRLPSETERGKWWSQWALVAFGTAAVATTLDAFLLQRRRTFFTGGFLSVDHVRSPIEAAAFVAGSLVSDFCILGIAVVLTLWLCGHLRLTRGAAITAAIGLSLGPILIADFVAYQLLTYLGDTFDLGLMFQLAGRRPSEIAAVSFAHLTRVAWLAGIVVVIGATAWLVRRSIRSAISRAGIIVIPARQAMSLSVGLLVVGALCTGVLRSSADALDNGLRRKPTGQLLGAIADLATDFDRDGFGMLRQPRDPNPFDAVVRPYAIDVPGDGIDENGVGGDLSVSEPPYAEAPWQVGPWRSKPDIVLIVLESFRADAVGAMLGGKPVTPTLDALAARGIAVSHSYSHNGYTVQSRRHIFTGSVADIEQDSTLIDDFRANGYETAYFSAQDESFGGPAQGVGFDRADVWYDARVDRRRRYSTFSTPGSLAVPFAVLSDRVREYLRNRATERPLFLYVNFHDTHFPYHHEGIQSLVSETVVAQGDISPANELAVREMYLNTAANVDRAIKDLLLRVREALGRDPGVVVLSDHGESLFEESFLGHGYALNDAQTRIPLIVANLPVAIEEPFGQSDLRRMLHVALADPAAGPIVLRDKGRRVFQYLGTIERPAQIAFVTTNARTIFDLRNRRARIGQGDWQAESTLTGADREQVIELVHTWERMLLARKSASRTE